MSAKADIAFKVHSLYREVLDWVGRTANEKLMAHEPRQRLDEFASGGEVPTGVVLTRLSFLAKWHAAKAAAVAFEGESPDAHLVLSHRLSLIELRLALRCFEGAVGRRRDAQFSRNALALHLVRATAGNLLGDGHSMETVLREHEHTGFFDRDPSAVVPFVLALAEIERNNGSWRALTDHGNPYHALLGVWNSTEEVGVASAISDACDFHLSRVGEHSGTEFFEFSDQVYALYPVEILAFIRVRRLHGIPTRTPEHPLMNAPMGMLRDLDQVPVQDSLIEQLEKRSGPLPLR